MTDTWTKLWKDFEIGSSHMTTPSIDFIKKVKAEGDRLKEMAENWTNFYEKMKPTLEKAEKWDEMKPIWDKGTDELMRSAYDLQQAKKKIEAIKTYLKEEKMVVYDSYNRYSAQIITHTKGMLLLSKLLEILEDEVDD